MPDIPFIGPILEFLQGLIPVGQWIDNGYNYIVELSFLEQLVGGLIFTIIIVLGLFSLIKKLSKLIIVVGILVGLWLLYSNGVFG
ncbi:MAG: hypothetical protein ACNA7U_01070 [Candidatus Izemoplasmataceae bacterium]|jgi:hypothetical protein|uniref:hypothetical protein n=1 Tax=Liberiplasma polymorphum TaxID=3374570 RepID=UPI003776541B